MTLVKARAAFETAIKDAVFDADPTVTVVFDNTPFNTPGLNKKYNSQPRLYTSHNSTSRSSPNILRWFHKLRSNDP